MHVQKYMEANNMVRLSPVEIQSYLSAYLSGGWRQDELVLESVDVAPGRVVGSLKVVSYFMPSDGVFHFTVPLAFIWVAQLALIGACWEHSLAEKPGEVYLREVNIQCRRMINKTEDIQISLTADKKRYRTNSVYYVGRIDIDRGAFVGSAKFMFPLPAQKRDSRQLDRQE